MSAAPRSHPLACPNCGAPLAPVNGPAHPYMIGSPACWAAFGALQAMELERFGYPAVHGLIVDSYAASHPGDGAARRDRQSVFIHLMALCAVLERGLHADARIRLLRRLTATKHDWPVLPRPLGHPALDHTSLRDPRDLAEYEADAGRWARAVWGFWAPVHPQIRAALDRAYGG